MSNLYILGDGRYHFTQDVDLIIMDPPYGVDKHGRMLGQISANYHEAGTHSRGYADHDKIKYAELMIPLFRACYRALPAGGVCVSFMGNRTQAELISHATYAGLEVIDVLTFLYYSGGFAKSTTTLVPRHEDAVYLRKPGGVRHINPDRNLPNVFDITKRPTRKTGHPAQKSDAWLFKLVEIFSNEGDRIGDPTAGAASLGPVAHLMGREFVMVESDPEFYHMGVQHLNAYSIPRSQRKEI